MRKRLLIVSGGIEAVHGIRRAKELGLEVLVSDMNPEAPGMREADIPIIASTYDGHGTLAALAPVIEASGPIQGVLAVGADVPLTVAAVAAAHHLPGIGVKAANLATDKLAMKERFEERGVPVPWFAGIGNAAELEKHRTRHDGLLVVKPVDSRGSRGVVRLAPDIDTVWAFEQARAISPSGRVMAEAYLPGPQISTESLILPEGVVTPGFSDRNYEHLSRYHPYFIENGGDLPSHLGTDIQSRVKNVVAAAADAMGLTTGTVKGDVVVHDGKPHIIEIAPRLSGGYFCTLEIPLNTGVDFIGCAIRLALGERVLPEEAEPKFLRPIVQRYLFPEAGRILAIEGIEEARRRPGILHLIVSGSVGAESRAARDTTSRAAMVIATGGTIGEARRNAETAIGMIRIRTQKEAAA